MLGATPPMTKPFNPITKPSISAFRYDKRKGKKYGI